jgi:exonuclease III
LSDLTCSFSGAPTRSQTDSNETDPENLIFPLDELPSKMGNRILSYNIRSLNRTKFNSFKHLCLKSEADLISLQEVWDIPANFQIDIPGFHPPFQRLRVGQRGGGVLTYVRDSLPAITLPSPFIPKVLESQLLEVIICKTTYHVLNCYFGQRKKNDIILALVQF